MYKIPGMTTYPLSSPPRNSGIYLLKNQATGQLYVGQALDLRRRWLEWRSAFNEKIGVKSKVLLNAIAGTRPEDWTYQVLVEVEQKDLDRLERAAITRLKDRGPLLLNSLQSFAAPRRGLGGISDTAKSMIMKPFGGRMSYAEAAIELGITPQAVKKKLQRFRKIGITLVKLEDGHLRAT